MRTFLAVVLSLAGCGTSAAPAPAPAPSATPPEVIPPEPAPLEPTAPEPPPPPATGCLLRGCTDGASVRVALPPEHATAGAHRFTLERDGVVSTCTADLTGPIGDSSVSATCERRFTVRIGPVVQAVPVETGVPGTAATGFAPVPGRFQWTAQITGTPARMHLVHTHDGVTVFDASVSPTYVEERPNGPGCDPICRRATIEL